MSPYRDDKGEMPTRIEIDDTTAEAVVRGAAVSAEFATLAATVDALRSIPEQPVRPSAELAARMAAGDFPSAAAQRAGRRSAGRHARRRFAAVPLRVRVVAGAALAVGGLATATAAGALPGPAQQHLQNVIESVTPFEFTPPSGFGGDVSDDARDGGVDGTEISEDARELGVRPDRPGDGPDAGSANRPADRGQHADPGDRTEDPWPPAIEQRPGGAPPGHDSAGTPSGVTPPGPPAERPGRKPGADQPHPNPPGNPDPPGDPDPPRPPAERPVQPRETN